MNQIHDYDPFRYDRDHGSGLPTIGQVLGLVALVAVLLAFLGWYNTNKTTKACNLTQDEINALQFNATYLNGDALISNHCTEGK